MAASKEAPDSSSSAGKLSVFWWIVCPLVLVAARVSASETQSDEWEGKRLQFFVKIYLRK